MLAVQHQLVLNAEHGRLAEDGRIAARYKLAETRTAEISESIWQNVSAAQATVVFDSGASGRRAEAGDTSSGDTSSGNAPAGD
jgi:hypothetical protein